MAKRYLSLCWVLVCLLCMCSCQQKTNSATSDEKKQSENSTQKTVAKGSLLTVAEYLKIRNKYAEVSQDALLEKASKDDADAIYELAKRADNPMNRAEAFRLYHHAAVKGHIIAQRETAVRLISGDGVGQDVEEGTRWLEKAVENGEPFAANHMAGYYVDGTYKQNGKKAIELAEKAVKAGCLPGYYVLGLVYYQGISVKQDYNKAFSYFMKGANGEPPVAMCATMVGASYIDGTGVEKDYDKGITWLKLAARHDSNEAVLLLNQLGVNPY